MKIKLTETVVDIDKERSKRFANNLKSTIELDFSREHDIETKISNMYHELAQYVRKKLSYAKRGRGAYPLCLQHYTCSDLAAIEMLAPSSSQSYDMWDSDEKLVAEYIYRNRDLIYADIKFIQNEMSRMLDIAKDCPAGSKYAFDRVDMSDRLDIPNTSQLEAKTDNICKYFKN